MNAAANNKEQKQKFKQTGIHFSYRTVNPEVGS